MEKPINHGIEEKDLEGFGEEEEEVEEEEEEEEEEL